MVTGHIRIRISIMTVQTKASRSDLTRNASLIICPLIQQFQQTIPRGNFRERLLPLNSLHTGKIAISLKQ